MKKSIFTILILLCFTSFATAQILDTLRVGGITGGVPPFTFQWYRVPAATASVTAADTIAANRAPGDSQRDWYVVPTDEFGSWRFFAVVRSPYCGTYVLSNLSGVRTVTCPFKHPNFLTGCQNIWGDGTTSIWNIDIGQVFFGAGNNTDPNVGSTTVNGTVGGVARTQVWSAHVRTEFCSNRTTAMTTVNNRIDCRNNTENLAAAGGFDYFSWCFVMRYANLLCPYPWRVPTTEDFHALDTIFAEAFGSPASPDGGADNPAHFGGWGQNRVILVANRPAWNGDDGFYRGSGPNQWAGGLWTGWAANQTNSSSYYWSSTPNTTTTAFSLGLSSTMVIPRSNDQRYHGFALRCIREPL